MRRERMFLVFIKSSSAGGIGDCEKTANSIWMKFGYVVENGRKWGCRQSLSKIVQTDFESGAYKVGKSPFFLFLALIFFWKIHREAPLGFGTLKFCMNMLIAYI